MCGAISPTKPSSPAKLTAAPASAAATASRITRVRLAFMPRLEAVSAPSVSTSSSLVSESAAASETAIITAGIASRCIVRLASEPMRKSE